MSKKNFTRTNLKVGNIDAYSEAVRGLDIRPRTLGLGRINVTQDFIDFTDIVLRVTRFKGSLVEEYSGEPNWLTLSIPIQPITCCGHQLPSLATETIAPNLEGVVIMAGRVDLLEFSYSKEACSKVGLELDNMIDRQAGKRSYPLIDTETVAWAWNLLYGADDCTHEAQNVRERALDLLSDWIYCPDSSRTEIGGRRLEITKEVIRLIDTHPDRFLTVAEIAHLLSVSECWVRRSFRSTMGMSIYQYERESKLTAAFKMLAKGSQNVTTVATQLGFNHLGRFSQYYRNRFGELPVQTRRRTRTIGSPTQQGTRI